MKCALSQVVKRDDLCIGGIRKDSAWELRVEVKLAHAKVMQNVFSRKSSASDGIKGKRGLA